MLGQQTCAPHGFKSRRLTCSINWSEFIHVSQYVACTASEQAAFPCTFIHDGVKGSFPSASRKASGSGPISISAPRTAGCPAPVSKLSESPAAVWQADADRPKTPNNDDSNHTDLN